ncbi:hypothetical protein F8M41_019380 [Gigaspora margarita]|uniref:Uncharacterized protein n=1 Tax=Gigaspora margarita TaxID=4874 RepID=A0A8H4B5K2_GIGMA|nr:hypothetical protein F8M41_019380 [Gigaspora margarita]
MEIAESKYKVSKIKTLFYNLTIAIIVVCFLVGLSTEFSQLEYSYFTYTEIPSQANLTENPPRVLVIRHYQNNESTSIVHIGRENYATGTNLCLEQTLLLRVLQGNGRVIEININNTKEIQDINYCYVNDKNPINIYPLFDQYILVSYIHANDTSDSTTYMDRGMVIDWNGNIMSIIDFGASYLFPNSTIWEPNELIVNNIVPRKGFLRLSRMRGTNDFEWRQYGYLKNGIFNLLQNNTFTTDSTDLTNFQVTVVQTLDSGYAIIYSDMSFGSAILYAMKLKYNEKASVRFTLYQLTQPNITFTSLFCSADYVYVGHLCIATVSSTIVSQAPTNMTNISTATLIPLTISVTVLPARPTTSAMQGLYHLKIRFLSSGSVLEANRVVPNEISGNIRTMPHGGYTSILQQPSGSVINFSFSLFNEINQLFDYNIQMNPIITNLFGAFDILQNNTMLVAQNETFNALNLVSIQLPSFSSYKDSGYGNFHVNTTYPQKGSNNLVINNNEINITFNVPISLADGKLFIYQKFSQSYILRQVINSKNCTQCIALDNVLTLNVYDTTFNEPGTQYSIHMDNNFVQNSIYDEAILGIDPDVWTFQTANIDTSQRSIYAGDILGILRLTTSGSQYFQTLNDSARSEFFSSLINELTIMIPAENNRLSSDGRHQFDPTTEMQILISFSISQAKGGENLLSTQLAKNLDQLIIYGAHTGISTGNTTVYLDHSYGFRQNMTIADLFDSNQTMLILLFIGINIVLLFYTIGRFRSPESENSIILRIGITLFRFGAFSAFVFTNTKNVPRLFVPSIIFFTVPKVLNLSLAFIILFLERNRDFVLWFSIYGKIASTFAIFSILDIEMLLILRSRLMMREHFNAPLSQWVLNVIFWGSCINLILAHIPEFIIQVCYK